MDTPSRPSFPSRGGSVPDAPTVTGVGGLASARPAAAASFELEPGRQFGPYRIVGLLGRGGMGEVYEAEESASGRRVALKLFNRPLGDPTERERFLREGRLAASISHPNCVYIYGTDEIEGVPVIAMELAPGGTLKDLVKSQGPLSPRKAVDAILQVIDGLEAAAGAGVLHRDVKPANCFTTRDGRVKVGDFGLSLSTLGREETQLTLAGTVLGTPAFAPPEQLRAETVDERADIYSVGATLYYLLTGKPPFDSDNLVALMSMVLSDVPPSPRALQSGVPVGLAAVVTRCLAKRPVDRPASYDEVRQSLAPFSSLAAAPAALGLRFVAGFIDTIVCAIAALPISTGHMRAMLAVQNQMGTLTDRQIWTFTIESQLITLAYFTVAEGLWGASIGKAILGLRVVDEHRQVPGTPRAFVRVLLYVASMNALLIVLYLSMGGPAAVLTAGTRPDAPFWLRVAPSLTLLGFLMLFVSARAANGFAGLHDLVTATRVIRRQALSGRRGAQQAPAASAPAASATSERIGPYLVVARQHTSDGGEVVTAFDEQLRRSVWIRPVPAGRPPLPAPRRESDRPGRARWLNGCREPDQSWDAFEAWPGRPLGEAFGAGATWEQVRGWLADLNAEVQASAEADDVPILAADRIWLADDGRAKLLDWPVPAATAVPASGNPASGLSFADLQRLFHQIATRALACNADSRVLPLHAIEIVDRLAHAGFRTSADLAQALAAAAGRPDAVPRWRRALHLTLAGIVPCFLVAISVFVAVTAGQVTAGRPDTALLKRCLDRLAQVDQRRDAAGEQERHALEIFIAGRLRNALADPNIRRGPIAAVRFQPPLVARAQRFVADHPRVSDDEMRQARAVLKSFLEKAERSAAREAAESPWESVPFVVALVLAAFGAIPSILCAFAFRGGPLLRGIGLGLATGANREVSRWRAGVRAVVAWAPILIAAALLFFTKTGQALGVPSGVFPAAAAAMLLLFAVGSAVAIASPSRSLQDRIVRTWIVPR